MVYNFIKETKRFLKTRIQDYNISLYPCLPKINNDHVLGEIISSHKIHKHEYNNLVVCTGETKALFKQQAK